MVYPMIAPGGAMNEMILEDTERKITVESVDMA
jgi:hypothetical protein